MATIVNFRKTLKKLPVHLYIVENVMQNFNNLHL